VVRLRRFGNDVPGHAEPRSDCDADDQLRSDDCGFVDGRGDDQQQRSQRDDQPERDRTGPGDLSTVSCSSGSLTGAGTDACTVALTSAATSATAVTLSSSSSAVTVPASVTITSGSSSAGFTATATAVSSTQTATLTATATGVSKTFALTLTATMPNLTLSATNVTFGNVQLIHRPPSRSR